MAGGASQEQCRRGSTRRPRLQLLIDRAVTGSVCPRQKTERLKTRLFASRRIGFSRASYASVISSQFHSQGTALFFTPSEKWRAKMAKPRNHVMGPMGASATRARALEIGLETLYGRAARPVRTVYARASHFYERQRPHFFRGRRGREEPRSRGKGTLDFTGRVAPGRGPDAGPAGLPRSRASRHSPASPNCKKGT